MKKVAVSFLTSKDASKDIDKLEATDADFIHIDVMDGKFVKAKNMPFKLLTKKFSSMQKRLDVHLMAVKPLPLIENYVQLNTEYITVHIELETDVLALIDKIKSYGIKAGLAVNPETDVELVYDYLDYIDYVLIMCVKPGAGGQAHIDMSAKVNALKEEIASRNVVIAVDGGINKETVKNYANADIIVSGSYVIDGISFQDRIGELR